MNPASASRERILDAWHDLLFAVRRSRRYHLRREQSFSRLHFVAGFLTTVGGFATFATVLAERPEGVVLAALTAGCGAVALVGQPLPRALTHRGLIRSFARLEQEMHRPESEVTESELHRLQARRLEIEAGEPPTIRVVDLLCHNEEVVAGGYGPEHLVRVRWRHRILALLFDLWPPRSIQKSAPPT